MEYRTCPFCKEKIYSNALVCRFCKRDLPDRQSSREKSGITLSWIPAVATTAFIVTGAAFLANAFIKERRNWLER
jgi:hypothetical protein